LSVFLVSWEAATEESVCFSSKSELTSSENFLSKRGELLAFFWCAFGRKFGQAHSSLFVSRRNNDDYLFASLGLSTAGSLSFSSAFHFLRPPERTMALRLFWIKTRPKNLLRPALSAR